MINTKIILHASRSALTFAMALLIYDTLTKVAKKSYNGNTPNHYPLYHLCGIFIADVIVICLLNSVSAVKVV